MLQPCGLKGSGAHAEVVLAGADAHHIHRVLRLRPGDEIEASWQGRTYVVRLTQTTPSAVQGRVIGEVEERREPQVRVVLAQALLKGEKLDWVIQKGAELGVEGVVILEAERAVVHLSPEKAAQRRERWQRIAREAAQQCGRPVAPFVTGPLPLLQVVASPDYASHLKLLAWEGENDFLLRRALVEGEPKAGVLILIGPEGGFTAEEVAAACRTGTQPVSLGPRILRAETAALAVVAAVLYACGELG